MHKVTEQSLAKRLVYLATKKICLLRMIRIRRITKRLEAIELANSILG